MPAALGRHGFAPTTHQGYSPIHPDKEMKSSVEGGSIAPTPATRCLDAPCLDAFLLSSPPASSYPHGAWHAPPHATLPPPRQRPSPTPPPASTSPKKTSS